MRKIFPTAPIRSAAVPITLTRNIDGGIDNLTVKRDNGQEVNFDTWLRETFTDSLVVIRGDEIVWERYMNGMTGDQPHQMMSVTKSFAGLLGLMAVGQVSDMVNSMDFSEDYADPSSGVVQYGKVLGLLESPADEIPADNLYDYLATLPKDDAIEHGQVFTYQTPKADVVNWITNRATGEPFEDYMNDKLWSKLGTQG
jgi:hypothetical protein